MPIILKECLSLYDSSADGIQSAVHGGAAGVIFTTSRASTRADAADGSAVPAPEIEKNNNEGGDNEKSEHTGDHNHNEGQPGAENDESKQQAAEDFKVGKPDADSDESKQSAGSIAESGKEPKKYIVVVV